MIWVVLFIIGLLVLIWLAGFIAFNDFSIPLQSIKAFKKVLFIFPHPDDEAFNTGGLLYALHSQGSATTLIILTKGEKGTPDAHLEDSIKQTRTEEAQKVAKILGITKLIHEDLGDGELTNKKTDLTRYLTHQIQAIQPDLIITYDLAGMYGHPDHIATTEVVTDLTKTQFPRTSLWYVSFPKRVLKMMKLPVHMAKDPAFRNRQSRPDLKVFLGSSFYAKSQAIRAYHSQYHSMMKSMPIPQIPIELYSSLQLFEYYSNS